MRIIHKELGLQAISSELLDLSDLLHLLDLLRPSPKIPVGKGGSFPKTPV